MTEPVAYLAKSKIAGISVASTKKYSDEDFEITPLYTTEQLHPRVKMTKEQHDRLMWDKENTDLFQCIDYFNEHDGNSKFGVLTENLKGDLTQEDIARAWLNPEETIEIIPNMKWFVRSKEVQSEDDYFYLINPGQLFPLFTTNIERAGSFSTKEEAEKWTNPLTEAVQLPVEEK